MIEKIDKIQALLNVPNVDADTEVAIANMKILNLLVDLRAESKQLILSGVSKRLNEKTLEEINTIMWESHMVKSRTFDREQGTMIMKELEKWAKR